MKVWTVAILAAITVFGCRTTNETSDSTVSDADASYAPLKTWMTLHGSAADELYKAMNAAEIGKVKMVKGKASIFCDLQSGNIPDGAQGIVAPMANCGAYPRVTFPNGAMGLIAPWFNLNGFSGYQFYSKMPVTADQSGDKSMIADFEIVCKKKTSYCRIRKGAEYPVPQQAWITLEGNTAKKVYDSMNASAIGNVKKVEGNMSLYCKAKVPSIPAGAQGIAAPMADCVSYPIVQFPNGAQGLVAPWFNLNGFDGFVLWEKMTGIQVNDNAKSYSGKLSITCTKSTSYKCEFVK